MEWTQRLRQNKSKNKNQVKNAAGRKRDQVHPAKLDLCRPLATLAALPLRCGSPGRGSTPKRGSLRQRRFLAGDLGRLLKKALQKFAYL